jgi:acyl dehydratase
MNNLTFDEIEVGATESLTHTLTQTEIEVLALVSGDANPFYTHEETTEARADGNITQGVGAEALISAVLGTKLPGPGMKIIEQNLRLRGTIAVGDELTATVTAKKKHREGSLVVFDCRCVNQDGQELVSGTVTVSAPTKKISFKEITPPQLVLRRGDAFVKLFSACLGKPN